MPADGCLLERMTEGEFRQMDNTTYHLKEKQNHYFYIGSQVSNDVW